MRRVPVELMRAVIHAAIGQRRGKNDTEFQAAKGPFARWMVERSLIQVKPPSPFGEGGSGYQPIEIRRGLVSWALGSVRVSTPSSSSALIRSRSILLDSVNDRV